jgi:ClpP class serine protease
MPIQLSQRDFEDILRRFAALTPDEQAKLTATMTDEHIGIVKKVVPGFPIDGLLAELAKTK